MLTIFRKIRKQLLDRGIKRYFIYAIGEIFLVVIGILLALQINTWNQTRLNGIEEERIIAAVADEVNMFRWQTNRGIRTYNSILASSDRLVSAINVPGLKIPRDTIDLDLGVLTSRWLMGMSNESNIYDALTGSGELGLIKSDALRDKLSDLKRELMLLASYEGHQTRFVDNHLFPYLNQHIDGVKISNIRSRIRQERFGYNPPSMDLSINASNFTTSYDRLLSSKYFSNLLLEHMRHTSSLLPIYIRIKNHIAIMDSILTGKNLELIEN